MIAFLTSRVGIAGMAGVLIVLMWVAWGVNVNSIRANHATEIAAEQKRSADTQRAFDDYKLQVAQAAANQERIRADENARALNEREALVNEVDRLRTLNATATRQRNAASAELQRILNNARPEDTSKLGPAARGYLDGVRRAQRTAPAASNPTPPG